jgi:hypothetical protein
VVALKNSLVRFPPAACLLLALAAGGALQALTPDFADAETRQPSAEELPPLSADRPGYTTNADVLGRGLLQFETGTYLQVQTLQSVTARSLQLATPLVRAGLFKRVEFRVGGSGYVRQSSATADGRRISGVSDHSVGAKIGLLQEGKWLPALTVIPTVSLPIGCRPLTSSGHDPNVVVSAAKTLPHDFSATANFVAASLTDGEGRFTQDAWSVSASHPVGGGISGSLEVYRIRQLFRDVDGLPMLGLGLSRVLGGSVQVDIQAGHSLEPGLPAWFLGAGFVLRLPVARTDRSRK